MRLGEHRGVCPVIDTTGKRRAAQQKIRRRCSCGRVITGNPGWASHQRAHTFTDTYTDHDGTTYQQGDWLPGHGYEGRVS